MNAPHRHTGLCNTSLPIAKVNTLVYWSGEYHNGLSRIVGISRGHYQMTDDLGSSWEIPTAALAPCDTGSLSKSNGLHLATEYTELSVDNGIQNGLYKESERQRLIDNFLATLRPI